MSQSFDDLSIEELQNKLLEIQKKIKEKEIENLIEKISTSLRGHDASFIYSVLDIVEGRKSIEKFAKKEKNDSPKVGTPSKNGVYLRNGKVFCGIQEIKYIRLDKNGILRISREGKGLPPKVSSLHENIQKVVMTLPHKNETTAASTSPSIDSEVPEVDSTPQTAAEFSTLEPVDEPMPLCCEGIEEIEIGIQAAEPELPQNAPEPSPEPEPEAPRKRKAGASRAKSEESSPASEAPSDLITATETVSPAMSRKAEMHALQESFF